MPLFFFLLTTLLPAVAWAADSPDMASALLRTAWALLVVVGLILALYGLSKKRLLLLGKSSGTAIKIVELRPVQPKSTLALVEVRGREYLLGISANAIHLLADLSGEPVRPPADFPTLLAKEQ